MGEWPFPGVDAPSLIAGIRRQAMALGKAAPAGAWYHD